MIALTCSTVLPVDLSQQLDVSFFGRNELMQRRIEETDVNRLAFHGLVELLKVALLHRLELSKGSFSALRRCQRRSSRG